MTHRVMLTLALALATILPVAAQDMPDEQQMPPSNGTVGTDSNGTTGADSNDGTVASGTMMPLSISQGVFVGHRSATGQLPETVTLRFDYQGTPVLGTFAVERGQRWMSAGQTINWANISEGAMVTVPSNARLIDLTFGGNVGVGTITSMNAANNTLTVRLPSGETRILRHAANPILIRNGQVVPVSQLATGQTVLFEIPPAGNQVALLREVGTGIQGTVTNVTDQGVTVRFMENGRQVTRTYPFGTDTNFFSQGTLLQAENATTALSANQPVWIYGPSTNPTMIVAAPTAGFETAVVTGTQPEVAVTPPTTPEVSTTAAMAAPFDQGTLVSYAPATDTAPAMATVRFNWNGTPLLGTFMVTDQSNWMSQGQPVDFAQLQPGATLTVPQGARLANLTFGGASGIGTITAIDRSRNTMTVRLPSGQTRVLRYSPQAVLLRDNAPTTIAELNTGDTVMFEVVPNNNMVGILMPVEPGVQGTITAVSPTSITVRYMQDGQMVTSTIPVTDQTRFLSSGMQVTTVAGSYRVGQPVWIYGSVEQPQIVATGVQQGFEAAVVTPQPTVTTAVGGVRQQPAPQAQPRPRRVIRGRW